MQKIKRTNRCNACNYCKKVYENHWYSFFGEMSLRYCTVHRKLTRLLSGCEKWRKREYEYDLSPKRFNKVESDIKYIVEQTKDI